MTKFVLIFGALALAACAGCSRPAPAEPSRATGQPTPTPTPLEVALVDLDKPSYRVGDALVYRLEVRNRGSEPYAFPMEPDRSRVVHVSDQQLSRCTFRLDIRDARDTAGFALPEKVLYGSSSSPDSRRILGPGENVRIEVPGTWLFPTAETERAFATLLPGLVQARASLSCAGPPEMMPRSATAQSITNAWILLEPKPPVAVPKRPLS